MSSEIVKREPEVIAAYTAAPWESAVVVLRITGPADHSGIRVIRGNEGEQVSPEFVTDADIVLIQRDFPRFWTDYKRVIDEARFDGKPVVYDLDDLLVEIPTEHSHSGDYMGELLGMVYALLDADIVTASSPTLVEYLSELNPNTRLLRNYLNDRMWQLNEPKVSSGSEEPVVIGYMGGQTHQSDLNFVADVLLKVLNKYSGKVRLRFWGVQPPQALLDSPDTDWVSINQEDYAEFAKFFLQQECDICIAPLREDGFNQAKSSLKFLEYSALGVAGVYSKLPPYEVVVEHGINGFLASNLEEWEKNLSDLIDSPELRLRLAIQAQRTVTDHWLLSRNHKDWIEVYKEALFDSKTGVTPSVKHNNLMRIISQSEDYQATLEDSLFEVSNQLSDILDSRSWRLLRTVQNLRMKLVPEGGILERLLFGGRDETGDQT
jgi:glycosyltransferase involved in cell wall biosynthesis